MKLRNQRRSKEGERLSRYNAEQLLEPTRVNLVFPMDLDSDDEMENEMEEDDSMLLDATPAAHSEDRFAEDPYQNQHIYALHHFVERTLKTLPEEVLKAQLGTDGILVTTQTIIKQGSGTMGTQRALGSHSVSVCSLLSLRLLAFRAPHLHVVAGHHFWTSGLHW